MTPDQAVKMCQFKARGYDYDKWDEIADLIKSLYTQTKKQEQQIHLMRNCGNCINRWESELCEGCGNESKWLMWRGEAE